MIHTIRSLSELSQSFFITMEMLLLWVFFQTFIPEGDLGPIKVLPVWYHWNPLRNGRGVRWKSHKQVCFYGRMVWLSFLLLECKSEISWYSTWLNSPNCLNEFAWTTFGSSAFARSCSYASFATLSFPWSSWTCAIWNLTTKHTM